MVWLADIADILQSAFLNENCYTMIKMSLKYHHKVPIVNNSYWVSAVAGYRPRDKPLSEPTRILLTDAYMRHLSPRWVNP